MKKIGLFTVILAVPMLIGCGGGSYTVPTTPYEKVKTAFTGVEKSMKNISTSNDKNETKVLYLADTENTLNSLFSIYNPEDNLGDTIDELSYTEPPMIHFQCLKYAFEKIGNNYSFDTKYYDTINGKVYVDFETGFEMEHLPEYEYNYSFTLGLGINIDSNDLITADVSFDITLSKGEFSYQSKWYVNMILDYNMDEENPTYTLKMLTNNDEKGLPYYDRCVYEYDYVNVVDNKIVEWRKFDLEGSIPLTKDASHQKFDTYINGDISYRVGVFAWYKNNSFYKAKDLNRNIARKEQVATLFYQLGLNNTDINGNPFFNKEGVKNNVIQSMYQEFSNLFRKDIIYSLVTRDEDGREQTVDLSYIQVVDFRGDYEVEALTECFISEEKTLFSSLINNQYAYHSQSPFIPKINLLNKKHEFVKMATMEDLDIKVRVGEEKITVNANDKVTDIASRYDLPIMDVEFSLMKEEEVVDFVIIRFNVTPYIDSIKEWPKEELAALGLKDLVPTLASKSYYASAEVLSQSTDPYSIYIGVNNIDSNDRDNYYQKLEALGYGKIYKNPTYAIPDTSKGIVFAIGFDGDYLKIEQDAAFNCSYSSKDKALFRAINQDILLPEGLVFTHPNYIDEMFDYYGVSTNVYNAFITRLKNNGWKENEDPYGQYKYYYDYQNVRYCLNSENIDDHSIRLTYFTGEIPTPKFDYVEMFIKEKGSLTFNKDSDQNWYVDYFFQVGDEFNMVGYINFPTSVTLDYNELVNDAISNEYLGQGKDGYIRVKKEGVLRITIVSDGNSNNIVCSLVGEQGEEGQTYSKDHSYSMVGEFNSWVAENGIELFFNNKNGTYTIENYGFNNGKGFVLVEDFSWNVYYGYSHLDKSYDGYLIEGETNGIIPIANFSATVTFKDGVISLSNITK